MSKCIWWLRNENPFDLINFFYIGRVADPAFVLKTFVKEMIARNADSHCRWKSEGICHVRGHNFLTPTRCVLDYLDRFHFELKGASRFERCRLFIDSFPLDHGLNAGVAAGDKNAHQQRCSASMWYGVLCSTIGPIPLLPLASCLLVSMCLWRWVLIVAHKLATVFCSNGGWHQLYYGIKQHIYVNIGDLI